MLKVGLTGGIGSGKTAVAGIFQVLGIPVFDADTIAKSIMEQDKQLIMSIQKAFGEESYIGIKLNRQFLSGIVFNDPLKLQQLNALVHPATIAASAAWINEQKTPYVIKEAALLFETGSSAHLDYIVGVSAPKDLRIQRVMERDNITREQVLARMTKQLDESKKMELCNYIVINDEQQLLVPQVLTLHKKLLKIAGKA